MLGKTFLLVCFLLLNLTFGQQGQFTILSEKGHAIAPGSSGFNVRIADKVWSYTHPDFKQAVHQIKPGWLRFFSGTMGDAFNSATGQYDLDYASMFDKPKQYLNGYQFTEIKGPHRLTDLYALLGEINGKLIITVNGFSETPEITKELARFVYNNNIEVELWQFCNEPYFYVPHRNRYWWNDGYDYAVKMKPHADEILKIFPKANLALNYTWDGIWGFMKEINKYQQENGAFWNTFSKHSYAPHVGKKESLEDAYLRANTKLLQATSTAGMREIEEYTQKDIPMVITEFGVWNKPLNGIYSSIYNIEYIMRQLQHSNTRFVGAHEVSNKVVPRINFNSLIKKAFKDGRTLNTDSLPTGTKMTLEGKAFQLLHRVTNNVDWTYPVEVLGGFTVPGLDGAVHEAGFAQAYRGQNGYDYLVVTNRSGKSGDFKIVLDGKMLSKELEINFISTPNKAGQNTSIKKEFVSNGLMKVRPFSVTTVKWKANLPKAPTEPRIYDVSVIENGVKLTWGPIPNADGYQLQYGSNEESLEQSIDVGTVTSYEIEGLIRGRKYFFKVFAKSQQLKSTASKMVSIVNDIPLSPVIFKTAQRDDAVTQMWKSVPHANGYMLKYVSTVGDEVVLDVKNVFGYRVEGLDFDQSYNFSVAAYNGRGQGRFSESVTVVPKKNIPYPPRNISATEIASGVVELKWIANKLNPTETEYTILRGEQPHDFEVLIEGVQDTTYLDRSAYGNKKYFYTVTSSTAAGESNFYPNIATPIALNKEYKIQIVAINREENGAYRVVVKYENIPLDGMYKLGVSYNNISYLNVEEVKVEASMEDKGKSIYEVVIPKENFRKGSRYKLKPYVNSNGKNLVGQSDELLFIE